MTDNATIEPVVRRRWYHRFRSLFRPDERDELILFGSKYDAHIYALVVAVGLPFMGLFVRNFQVKVYIALVWSLLAPVLYLWLEGMEINGQIERFGLLQQQASDRQRKTMIYPFYGAIFAFVVWFVVDAVVVTATLSETWNSQTFVSIIASIVTSPWVTPVRYGPIEWILLAHTVVVASFAISVYYPLMTNFLQSTAGQKRFEEKVP